MDRHTHSLHVHAHVVLDVVAPRSCVTSLTIVPKVTTSIHSNHACSLGTEPEVLLHQHPTTTMADKPLFSGVIPALLTPHTESGELDTASIAPLVEYLIESGVNGFYVCGSTGEGMSMSVDERKQMLEGVMVACGGRVPVMVMVGACPIKDAVALAQHAHGLGVDAISTVAPGAYTALGLSDEPAPPTFDASIAYFTAVGAATPLPFYPYWLSSIGSLDPRAFLEAMRPVPTFAGQFPLHSSRYLLQLAVLSACSLSVGATCVACQLLALARVSFRCLHCAGQLSITRPLQRMRAPPRNLRLPAHLPLQSDCVD